VEKHVAEHGHGPFFRHVPEDKIGRRSTYVARKIHDWMDGVIKDPNRGGCPSTVFSNAEHLAPNHSFRHYLKSQLLDRDVPERISDAITGHKTPASGASANTSTMTKKFKAIKKLPVIPLAAA
jgi:hypothetical protein